MHLYAEHLCQNLAPPDPEVMDLLLEIGTDFDQQATFIKTEFFENSWYTITPLQQATRAGHVALVKALIKKGCHVNQQLLRLAGYWGNIECARILLANGADPNGEAVSCKGSKHKPDKEIYFACYWKPMPGNYTHQPEFGSWRGLKKEQKVLKKQTIEKLYEQRQLDYLQALLDDPRTDINVKTKRMEIHGTPIYYDPMFLTLTHTMAGHDAVQALKLEKLILKDRSFLDKKDPPFHETPLSYACVGQHIEHIKVMLKHGADPNSKNVLGIPPIFRLFLGANGANFKTIITLLVKHGADVNSTIGDGQSLIHFLTTTRQVCSLLENCCSRSFSCWGNCLPLRYLAHF